MNELEPEHEVLMIDEPYTPFGYKGRMIKQPVYKGEGNHSLLELEEICKQFNEYCHQQAIVKQSCMEHIAELKPGAVLPLTRQDIDTEIKRQIEEWMIDATEMESVVYRIAFFRCYDFIRQTIRKSEDSKMNGK